MSLDPQTLALVRIAVATATGDERKLRDRMIAARAVHVPPQWVDELLLQSFLNVGYPLALVAFGVWRSLAGPVLESEKGESIACIQRLSHWSWSMHMGRFSDGRGWTQNGASYARSRQSPCRTHLCSCMRILEAL